MLKHISKRLPNTLSLLKKTSVVREELEAWVGSEAYVVVWVVCRKFGLQWWASPLSLIIFNLMLCMQVVVIDLLCCQFNIALV